MSEEQRSNDPSGAVISDCGRYRYTLERSWSRDPRYLLWVMLNPSTADAEKNDPTIRRCMGFAKLLGYDGILVGNLYALRATDPKMLKAPPGGIDAVGPQNDRWIRSLAARASKVICAWGKPGPDPERWKNMRSVLLPHILFAMGFTKSGQPRHPLMLPNTARPEAWFM